MLVRYNNLNYFLNEAWTKNKYHTTFFEVYDQTSEDRGVCRMIVIQPFSWVIFCINGDIKLFDQFAVDCPDGFTPLVNVPDSDAIEMKGECVATSITTIYDTFANGPHVEYRRIPFDIDTETFTAVDALNKLAGKQLIGRAISDGTQSWTVQYHMRNKAATRVTSLPLHPAMISHWNANAPKALTTIRSQLASKKLITLS